MDDFPWKPRKFIGISGFSEQARLFTKWVSLAVSAYADIIIL
jgi:hypothetical protein